MTYPTLGSLCTARARLDENPNEIDALERLERSTPAIQICSDATLSLSGGADSVEFPITWAEVVCPYGPRSAPLALRLASHPTATEGAVYLTRAGVRALLSWLAAIGWDDGANIPEVVASEERESVEVRRLSAHDLAALAE